jgi:RHS repeat-associated protein
MSGTPLRTTGVDNGTVRALVDVAGRPHISITAQGFVTTAKYDVLHRPLEIYCTGPGMPRTIVERMIYGEMLSPAEAAAIGNVRGSVIHHYDASGKTSIGKISFKGETLLTKKQLLPDDPQQRTPDWSLADDAKLEAEVFTSSSVFDALGRAIISVEPDQSILRPTFNRSGQLKKVSVNLRGAAVATDYVTDIRYNDKGQREAIYYNNGTRTKYEYEPLTYRLISLCTTRRTESGAIEPLQKLKYTYDPAGNITQITDDAQQTIFYNGEAVSAENRYVYNALYQLIEAHGREHAGQNVPYSQFDSERVRLLHKSDGAAMRRYCQRFVYDAAGNKTSVVHRSGENSWTKTLEIDLHSNRLSRSWFGDHAGEEQFAYDVAGNMQQLSSADSLYWNYRGELQGMSRGTMHSRYTYAGGQRIRKVVEADGLRKVRIYLGDFELYREYRIDGGTPVKTLERESLHISDGSQRIVLAETKTFELDQSPELTLHRYQFGNHLGSAALEVDEHAQIISYEEYYSYGNTSYQAVRSGTEVPEKRYRYTGMERDAESGLNYHSARYYAPWMGRWISADPAGTVDGLNLYHYVNGNPVNYADLTGNETPEPMEWQSDEAKCQRTPAAKDDVEFHRLSPDARAEWIEKNPQVIDQQGLIYDSSGRKIKLDFRPIKRYYEFQLQTMPYRSNAYYRVARAYNRFLNQESLGQFPDGTLNAGKIRDEEERQQNYGRRKVEQAHQRRQQAWEVFNGLGGAAAGLKAGRDAMTNVTPVRSNRPAIVEPQEPVAAPPVRPATSSPSGIIGPGTGPLPSFNDHKPDLVITQPIPGKPRQGPLKENTIVMMTGLGLVEKEVMGRTVYQLPDSAIVRIPGSSKSIKTAAGERVNLHHLWGREPGALVELPESLHKCLSKDLHWMIVKSFRQDPQLDKAFNTYRKNYMKTRNSE